MDLNLLKHDEFIVECQVRELVGSHLTMFENLVRALEGESQHEVLKPDRAHELARKNPLREIVLCAKKLCEFKEMLQDSVHDTTDDTLKRLESRLIHVLGRLTRISNSPTYKTLAEQYLASGKILLDVVQQHKSNPADLNQSLETVKSLNLSTKEIESSELEAEDEAKQSIRSVVNPEESVSSKDKITVAHSPLAHSSNTVPSNELLANLVDSPKSSELYMLLNQIGHLVKEQDRSIRSATSDSDGESSTASFTRDLKKPFRPSIQSSVGSQKPKVRFSRDQYSTKHASSMYEPVSNSKATPSSSTFKLPETHYVDINQMGTEELLRIVQNRFEKLGKPLSDPRPKPRSTHPTPNPNMVDFNPSIPPPFSSSSNHTSPPNIPAPPQLWSRLPVVNPSDLHPPPIGHRRPDRWNLKYSGSKNDSVPIDRFLARVERMGLRYQISQVRLVDELSFLLEGEALEWYWTYLEKMGDVTWPQIKNELIRRFQIRKSDDEIYREISLRKQDFPKESFYDFYSSILKMSMQLRVPMPDHELLRYLKTNMRPGFHLVLATQLNQICTIDQLILRCVEYEDLWQKFGYFPESQLRPPPRSVNEIASDFHASASYNENPVDDTLVNPIVSELKFNRSGYRPPIPQYADVEKTVQKTGKPSQELICFKCQSPGHYANACPYSLKKPVDEPSKPPICPTCHCASGNLNMEGRSKTTSPPQMPKASENVKTAAEVEIQQNHS